MKRIFSFLLLVISCTLYGQQVQNIAYYYKGRKLSFPVNQSRVVVGLRSVTATADARRKIAGLLSLPDSAVRLVPGNKYLSLRLPASGAASRSASFNSLLKQQSFVAYTHPCFTSNNHKEMGYGDELVVKLKKNTSRPAFDKLLQLYNCSIARKYPFAENIYILSAGEANGFDAIAVANRLYETGSFEYAEPDLTLMDSPFSDVPAPSSSLKQGNSVLFAPPSGNRAAAADPNDPYFSFQWSHKNTGSSNQYNGVPGADMKVQGAWDRSTGTGVTIAIIDEGVDIDHADLKSNMLQGFDCISFTYFPGDGKPRSPARGHGTACAGIIAAIANNSVGIAGVAPDSKIIPITFTDQDGMPTSYANLSAGIDFAWSRGADILSNSWSLGSPSSIIEDAINRALTYGRNGKGSLVLFASGNDDAGLSYPAVLPGVMAIGGVNMCAQRKSPTSCDGENWWGSSYGTGLSMVAPCVKIVTTDNSGAGGYNTAEGIAGDYTFNFNGTSSAAPAVAAVAALVWGTNPGLTATDVRTILENTCDKLAGYNYSPTTGQTNGAWNSETGYGRVNAAAAVQAASTGQFCAVQIVANGPTRLCAGSNVELTIARPNPNCSYQWRRDGVNFAISYPVTISQAGTYDVVAVNFTNGCTSIAAPVVVTTSASAIPLLADAGIEKFICPGQPVVLGGNPTAVGGMPVVPDQRVFAIDAQSNTLIKFSVQDPLHYQTVAQHIVSDADLNAGYAFSGGSFTPYGLYAIMPQNNRLVTIDTSNGVQQPIGTATIPSDQFWKGLSWDPAGKKLYGIANGSGSSVLYSIDPFTAAATKVAALTVYSLGWIAISNSGEIYVLSTVDNTVYRIDKTNGQPTALPATIGFKTGFNSDADVDPLTDSLYVAGDVRLEKTVSDFRIIHTATGSSTLIGAIGNSTNYINATGIAAPGYVYNWSPADNLVQGNSSAPVATPLSTTTYTLNVTDMCGNTASSQVTVHVNSSTTVPVITAPADSICATTSIRLSASKNDSYKYQWYRDGHLIPNATDSFYIAARGGSYTVSVSVGADCPGISLPFVVKSCELIMDSNQPVTLCNAAFYDSGGPIGTYNNNETFTRTITSSTPGSVPQLVLTSFQTENGYDILTVYDGPNTSSPVLASISGQPNLPITITGSSSTFTIGFTSNANLTALGFAGTIQCYQPRTYRSKASGNVSDINTWEVKSGDTYVPATATPQSFDDSVTIQSGHTVLLDAAIRLDQLWVKAGATLNVASPLSLNDGPGDDLRVDGTLLVTALGFINGTGNLVVKGSLDNTDRNGSVMVRTTINGNAAQFISVAGIFGSFFITNPQAVFNIANSIFFDSLIVNNGGTKSVFTTPGSPVMMYVQKKLILQSGIIAGNNVVVSLTSGDNTQQAGPASYVDDIVQIMSNDGVNSLFFAIGKNAYRPVLLNLNTSPYVYYHAKVYTGTPGTYALPTGVLSVSNTRYYNIASSNGSVPDNGSLTLTYGADDAVTDPASLRVVQYDGVGNWINLGGAGTGAGAGTITVSVNPGGAPIFALATGVQPASVLPVTWLGMEAHSLNNEVTVSWRVTAEVNVKNYVLQHSPNATDFTDLGQIRAGGKGVSENAYMIADREPFNGNNYYRVRQVDMDNNYTYSKVMLVKMLPPERFMLSPNPATTVLNIQSPAAMLQLQCFDGKGQLLYEAKPMGTHFSIPVKQWTAGIYYLRITAAGKVTQVRFVKQ